MSNGEHFITQNRFPNTLGLRLSRQALRVLSERGIFAHSPVTLEHQHLAKRYVVRGLESGGAAGDIGHYVTFTQEDGRQIEYLHPVEAIGVNGVHAVVVAPVLVRIEMLRKGRSYELLITQHRPGQASNGKRPPLETKVLFGRIHGRLELDLSGKDKAQAGTVVPIFYSLAGEELRIPKRFRHAVRAITKAVNCSGCLHCHWVTAPQREQTRMPTGTEMRITNPSGSESAMEKVYRSPDIGIGERPNAQGYLSTRKAELRGHEPAGQDE